MKDPIKLIGALAILLIGIIAVGIYVRFEELKRYIPPQWKSFSDLDEFDRMALQYDSVYGDYLQWVGIQDLGPGDPESITRKLVVDKSRKFAIKGIIDDKARFFTKIPGNIHYSGRWSESDGRLTLKFYFSPETWYQLFDSLKNENAIKFIDEETIEIDKNAKIIWIMGTECILEK